MLLEHLKDYQIILGSSSPRRQELLTSLGLEFKQAAKVDFDETYPAELALPDIPLFLSKKKSDSYTIQLKEKDILITADTIVVKGDTVLEKPADAFEAFKMLESLAGDMHYVHTGVYLRSGLREIGFVSTTEVTFSELTASEINYYIDTFKPYDKAGAYGIQEWIGYIAVEHIKGSYFNVMGLPVHQIYKELKQLLNI